jgi:hypothetical protein
MAIGTGAALLGSAVIGGMASSKAAKSQADAANRAAQLEREMFERQIELQEPFRQAGLTAQQRYMNLLGLSQSPTARTEQEIRNALAAQYMQPRIGEGGIIQGVDEAGLSAAVQAEMAKDAQARQEYEALKASPEFGKYTRDFGVQDFEQDPGYAFRMSEGLKALDRQAAARGGLISGGALKASQRYGQDLASQEYMNAFNRYQTNRANQLQPLESLMGRSQTAAQLLGTAGQNYASGAGQALQNVGMAKGSAYVGGANTLLNAIGQYQRAGGFNSLAPGGSSTYYAPDNIDIGGGMNPIKYG